LNDVGADVNVARDECVFISMRKHTRLISAFIVVLMYGVVGAWAASVDLRLSSGATGGGTLAVRVTFPDVSQEFRYGFEGGAPVVVLVPGGFEAGSLDLRSADAFLREGIVVLTFFFPGGGPPGIGSDGVYDQRGDTSQRALRDVLRFATGEIRDSLGRDLSEVVGGEAREDLVGMLGLSNGGSIAVTTLGRYGSEIAPLAFLVGWESPTSDQILGVELGTHDLDPDPWADYNGDGVVDNDVVNGAYVAYGFPQLAMDYNRMRFDPDAIVFERGRPVETGLFYFDNDGDGVYSVSDPQTGRTDVNGNGALDPWEDYPLGGIGHSLEPQGRIFRMLSRAATAHAEAEGIAPEWPAHYATAGMSADYWSIRDATEWFPAAMSAQPTIAGMSLFSLRDHVQSTTDHAHIHHWLDGFSGSGHWFRLNPDRAYVEAVGPGSNPELVDNDAGISPAPGDFQALAEPQDGVGSTVLQVAGVAEMADRVAFKVWNANLDGVIRVPPEGDTPSHLVTFAINCHDWVNPEQSADAVTFVLDTLEGVGARAELYVTAPVAEAWQRVAPQLIERLRDSDHTISYHVRAPHPVAFEPTREMLGETPLAAFETTWQDLATGVLDSRRPGGYQYVAGLFGRNPSATGLAGDDRELGLRFARITAARGARMAVFDHGPVPGRTGYENLALPEEALYPRPNDFFVARVNGVGIPGDGDFWWNRVAAGGLEPTDLAGAFSEGFLERDSGTSGQPLFSVVVIHENNLYMEGTPWRPVYFEDPESRFPKSPPWDLQATAPWVSPRTSDQIELIRQAFRALVEVVAADTDAAIVTSEDISLMADGLFSPDSNPQKTTQWLEDGGFENQPSEAYGWVADTPIGSDWGGEFHVSREAAQTGNSGMRVVAEEGFSFEVGVRVDIDKGEDYRFGAIIRSSGLGSVVFVLQPMEFRSGGLTPVGRPFMSSTLAGSFGWTRLEGVCALATNHAFVRLSIRIEGGGSVDVDNAFVESTEDRALVFPAEATAKVRFGTLVHIEDVEQLTGDTPYYRAKKQVLEDLASLFHRHGAVLTIQPEMEILTGFSRLDPEFIRHLRRERGCRFSVHTHGPKGPNPTIEEVLSYVAERKEELERMGAGTVRDLNGNFDIPDVGVFSQIGIFSMTAYKDPSTQRGYDGRYFHPWHPSPGNPSIDEEQWAQENPDNQVLYIPGDCTGLTRYRDRVTDKVLPGLTAALWNADGETTTTWYFITHVDFFASRDGIGIENYMQSDDYPRDLAAYEDLLFDVLDPMVERGFIQWAGPNEMARLGVSGTDESRTFQGELFVQ